MKNKYFISLVFLFYFGFGFSVNAQSPFDAAGVWTGHLYNDTTKQFIPFELAISNQNGQLSGYTYTVFIVDSVANVGVKEVTIKNKNGSLNVKDKKLIDDNYTAAPAKGVYTTIELQHSENDTADILTGQWRTNKTKEFFPLTGTIYLQKKKEPMQTKIVPKLIALGLGGKLSFLHRNWNDIADNKSNVKISDKLKTDTSEPMMTIVEPELVIMIPKDSSKNLKLPKLDNLIGAVDSIEKPKRETVVISEKTITKPNESILEIKKKSASESKKTENEKSVVILQKELPSTKPENLSKPGKPQTIKPTIVSKVETKPKETVLQKEEKSAFESKQDNNQKTVAVIQKEAEKNNAEDLSKTNKPVDNKSSTAAQIETKPHQSILQISEKSAFESKSIIHAKVPADLSNRKIETIRTVNVTQDSLVLSLFDNGAVDGDTVSVLLNGEIIISKVGLLARAFNKTIYLTPQMGDSIHIILYAENLGSIPPNTGLLVVRDGDKDYEIRFTGDLQKNSAIILTRKKE